MARCPQTGHFNRIVALLLELLFLIALVRLAIRADLLLALRRDPGAVVGVLLVRARTDTRGAGRLALRRPGCPFGADALS